MKKKAIAIAAALLCAMTCALSLAACGDEKDEHDIISESDWTAAFTVAQSATRYGWQFGCKVNAEHDYIEPGDQNKSIGYNAAEKQYERITSSNVQYFWEKDGIYYKKLNNDETIKIESDEYLRKTDFVDEENPFVLTFCKDKFSQFRYHGYGLEDGTIYYKADDVSIELSRKNDKNTNWLSGKANIEVAFDSEKKLTEIQAFVSTVDNKKLGFRLSEIDTYDNVQFDSFELPNE